MQAFKRLVALGDILGFSRTVLTNAAEDVVRGPIGFIRDALDHSMRHAGWPAEHPTLEQLRSNPIIGFAWFSDTILLFGREDSDRAARAVIETSAWLLHEAMHAPHSQMRFAVDYDEMFVDEPNGIYVGKAVVHTAELEKVQEWSGGALTDAAAARLEPVEADDFLIHYDLPLKGGSRRGTAINWAFAPHPSAPHLPPQWSRESAEPAAEDLRKYGSIATKWLNTKAFHDHACIEHGTTRRI